MAILARATALTTIRCAGGALVAVGAWALVRFVWRGEQAVDNPIVFFGGLANLAVGGLLLFKETRAAAFVAFAYSLTGVLVTAVLDTKTLFDPFPFPLADVFVLAEWTAFAVLTWRAFRATQVLHRLRGDSRRFRQQVSAFE